jgi:excisionase family DNA binding protein
MHDDTMSIRQAADALHVHRVTVWKLAKAGKLRTVGIMRHRQRVPRAEVERLLAEAAAGEKL